MKNLANIVAIAATVALVGCASQNADSRDPSGGKADSVGGEWQTRIEKDVADLQADSPRLWRTFNDIEGSATRPGFLRFRGSEIHHPKAASVFLTRYLNEREAEARLPLIEALPRTGGIYEDALVELMDSERDDTVRAMMVGVLGKGQTAKSVQGIVKGLGDSAVSVRLEAAVAAGRNANGARASDALQVALNDADASVRASAARSLGVLKVAAAGNALTARLSDDSADVRLQALRALSRIDAGAATRPEVARLTADPDARVRNVATKVTRANY